MIDTMLSRPQNLFDQLDAMQRLLSRSLGAEGAPGGIRSGAYGAFPEINVGRTPTSVEVFAFAPGIDKLLGLRRLLGLRSPINTVARLLDPFDAAAGVDGVFHPAYIETHLATAERLGRARLALVKGGGGEAERNPAKPLTVNLFQRGTERREMVLPALVLPFENAPDIAGLWRGVAEDTTEAAIVIGTIALALLALEPGLDAVEADRQAITVWGGRHG